MLGPLLRSVAENVEQLGLPEALTGPGRRGDAAGVGKHLETLARTRARPLPVLRRRPGPQLPLARALGDAPAESFDAIEEGLGPSRGRPQRAAHVTMILPVEQESDVPRPTRFPLLWARLGLRLDPLCEPLPSLGSFDDAASRLSRPRPSPASPAWTRSRRRPDRPGSSWCRRPEALLDALGRHVERRARALGRR